MAHCGDQGRQRDGQHGEDHHQAGGRQQEHLCGVSPGWRGSKSYQVSNDTFHFMNVIGMFQILES